MGGAFKKLNPDAFPFKAEVTRTGTGVDIGVIDLVRDWFGDFVEDFVRVVVGG